MKVNTPSDKRQLTDLEIQKIFDFTTKKYIKYYDVQVELVDHIALKIEDLQSQHPKLSFDQALHQVYKSFGVYGFTKVQSTKAGELTQFWSKRMRHYFFSYFKLPKVLLTLGLAVLILLLLNNLGHFFCDTAVVSVILWSILGISTLLSFIERKKTKKLQGDKKLLVIDAYRTAISLGTITGASMLPFWVNFSSINTSHDMNTYSLCLFALIFSFMIISLHASIYVFPVWLQEELEEKYSWTKDLRLSKG